MYDLGGGRVLRRYRIDANAEPEAKLMRYLREAGLGDQPPAFDIAANDAAHGSLGAHTEDRHGHNVPLQRDPNPQSGNRTVEGRIYGDPPWPCALGRPVTLVAARQDHPQGAS